MSLIPETIGAPKKKTLSPQEKEVKEQPILHASELIEIAKDVLNGHKVPAKERKEGVDGNYRTQDHWAKFVLKEVLSHASKRIWTNMVNASLEGMHKTIVNAQSNGDWNVMEYEVDIKVDADGEQQLCYGVRWIDMANKQDMFYQDGAPAVNVNVNSQIPPEMLEILKAKGASTDDGELKQLLTQLIGLMVKRESREAPAHTLPQPRND